MKFKFENTSTEILFQTDINIEFQKGENNVFVIDSKILVLYSSLFEKVDDRSKIYEYNAIEDNKNQASLIDIYRFLQDRNVNRNTRIFGIGGGVTTDIAAFAASTYKRGCRLILVPTTLLGMVDAAIGGKTGINFKNIKNGIGSFFPAEKVMVNPEFLKTQPEADYKAGLVEIVKMSFLKDSKLQSMLEQNFKIDQLIEEAVKTKMQLCELDLHDKSSRRFLNLGHTFGHVLESVSSYEISHGEAVAIGIRAAARLSLIKHFIDEPVYNQIIARLDRHGFSKSFPKKHRAKLLKRGTEILMQDKKADDKLNLILFKGLQELFVYKTDNRLEVMKSLTEFADD
ncbi:3-dehydroquinate synthase family protein [Candidatus Cloacimonadota bacterium]